MMTDLRRDGAHSQEVRVWTLKIVSVEVCVV